MPATASFRFLARVELTFALRLAKMRSLIECSLAGETALSVDLDSPGVPSTTSSMCCSPARC